MQIRFAPHLPRRWTTRTQLLCGFLGVALLGAGMGAVAIYKSSDMKALNDDMYTSSVSGLKYAAEANQALLSTGIELRNGVLALDLQGRTQSLKAVREHIERLNVGLRLASQKFPEPEGQALMGQALEVVEAFTLNASKVMEMVEMENIGATQGSRAYLMAVMQKQAHDAEAQLNRLMLYKSDHAASLTQSADRLYQQQLWTLIGTTATMVLLSLWIGLLLTRRLTRVIGGEPTTVANIAHTIAQGDLLGPIETARNAEGSIVHAMQHMQSSLIRLVKGVQQASHQIADSTQAVAQGNADLSLRTESQASSLQETAATMEQLSGTVKLNAAAAQHATELANVTHQAASDGAALVQRVIHTMDGIKKASHSIQDIIGVIDGIAFQTNLLALNAAVEAARAGEQGRGFGVVASEVRTLAQRSASAAQQIRGLIQSSQTQVGAGHDLVSQTGSAIAGIQGRIGELASLMREINDASQEQTSGIEQIGMAIAHLDASTQNNASLTQTSVNAATELHQQAQNLLRQVEQFRVPAH